MTARPVGEAWPAILGPVLDDPAVHEIFIAASGRVFVRTLSGERELDPTPLDPRRVQQLVRSARAPDGKDEPRRVGPGGAFGLIQVNDWAGSACLVLRRRSSLGSSFEQLQPRMISQDLRHAVELALEDGRALAVVSDRSYGRTALLSAMVLALPRDRRIACLGFQPGALGETRPQLICLRSDLPAAQLAGLGADVVVSDEPGREQLLDLLLSGRRLLLGVEATTMAAGLRVLVSRIIAGSPAMPVTSAESIVEGALDSLIELGTDPTSGQLRVLALGRLRRLGERLSIKPTIGAVRDTAETGLPHLPSDGGPDRLRSAGAAPKSKGAPPESISSGKKDDPPSSMEEVRRAIKSTGGFAVVSAKDFKSDPPPPGGPVGKVSAAELAELRPEQLVSKSFLVDVGSAGVGARLFSRDDEAEVDPAAEHAPLSAPDSPADDDDWMEDFTDRSLDQDKKPKPAAFDVRETQEFQKMARVAQERQPTQLTSSPPESRADASYDSLEQWAEPGTLMEGDAADGDTSSLAQEHTDERLSDGLNQALAEELQTRSGKSREVEGSRRTRTEEDLEVRPDIGEDSDRPFEEETPSSSILPTGKRKALDEEGPDGGLVDPLEAVRPLLDQSPLLDQKIGALSDNHQTLILGEDFRRSLSLAPRADQVSLRSESPEGGTGEEAPIDPPEALPEEETRDSTEDRDEENLPGEASDRSRARSRPRR